jgi:predicted XRE-type DNA-binding protein
LHDAEKLKIKAGLVIEIRKAMRLQGLTQQVAAKRMGITQSKVSDMMRGDFSNLSERKLMDCLNRLGYDIEIKVRPSADQRNTSARTRNRCASLVWCVASNMMPIIINQDAGARHENHRHPRRRAVRTSPCHGRSRDGQGGSVPGSRQDLRAGAGGQAAGGAGGCLS